jgi:hypothetical protein
VITIENSVLDSFTFSCFDIRVEIVKNITAGIFNDLNRKFTLLSGHFSIKELFEKKENIYSQLYSPESYKAIFFEPEDRPESTVMISNLLDGWLTLTNIIAGKIENPCYMFTLSYKDNSESKNSFVFYKNNGIARTAYVLRDGNKWIFYDKGDLQPFENPDNYKRRLNKDKINHTVILDYCSKIGINIENNKFWGYSKPGFKLEYKWS